RENVGAQHLACDNRSENLGQEHGLGIKAGHNLKLVKSFVPATENAIELEEENAQARISWILAYLCLEGLQRLGREPLSNQIRCSHTKKSAWRCSARHALANQPKEKP